MRSTKRGTPLRTAHIGAGIMWHWIIPLFLPCFAVEQSLQMSERCYLSLTQSTKGHGFGVFTKRLPAA
jgi:hypothetical protein